MKKILLLSILLITFYNCSKDDNITEETTEEIELNEIVLDGNVILSSEIPTEKIGELEVFSGFFKNSVGNTASKASNKNSKPNTDDVRSCNVTVIPNTVQLHILANNGNPLSYALTVNSSSNTQVIIDAKSTAISLLFMHKLLITDNPNSANTIIAKINQATDFNNLVNEVIALQTSGSLNNFTPNIIPENLPSYTKVIKQVLIELFQNFDIEQNGLVIDNVNVTGEEVTFTLNNRRKRFVSIYAEKYLNGNNSETSISLNSEDNFSDSELLKTKSFSFIDDFLFGDLYDNLNVSETYKVNKTNSEKIFIKCYGLGIDNNSFPTIGSDEFNKGIEPLVYTLFSDYAMPLWGLITGANVKKIELRGRPNNHPATKIITKWATSLKNDNQFHTAVAELAINQDYEGIMGLLGESALSFIRDTENTKLFFDLTKEIIGVKSLTEIGITDITRKLSAVVRTKDLVEGAVDIGRAIEATVTSEWTTEFIIDSNNGSTENIYEGDITLKTQQEVDDFGAKNYTSITGNLLIEGNATNISSLNSLNTISEINGYLVVNNNSKLTDLNGLSSITNVGSYVYIWNNDTLTSLQGLESIVAVGGVLSINGNNSLTSLCDVSQLITSGQITESEYIVSDNFYNPTFIQIQDNSSCFFTSGGIYNGNVTLTTQQEVDDFGANNYIEIIGNLLIEGKHDNDITNLNPLSSLTIINGDFKVLQNNLLINLNGLYNITSITGILHIGGNNKLSNIDDLKNIHSINALQIAGEDSLTSINALSKITTIPGSLHIYDNNVLINLNGLDNITNVGGEVSINQNDNLINLSLSKLTSIGSQLQIISNMSLINLNDLSNISSVNGNLRVYGNSDLSNLCGVRTLITSGIILENEYTVYNNAYNPTYEQIQNTGNEGCEK